MLRKFPSYKAARHHAIEIYCFGPKLYMCNVYPSVSKDNWFVKIEVFLAAVRKYFEMNITLETSATK